MNNYTEAASRLEMNRRLTELSSLKLQPKLEVNMEQINLEVRIDKVVYVTVDLNDVIQGINDAAMSKRWNYIASILRGVELDKTDLTDEQREIIKKFLTDKLSIF